MARLKNAQSQSRKPLHSSRNLAKGLALAVSASLLLQFAPSAEAAGRQFLRGHVPAIVTNLVPIGPLPASTRLNLAIGLPLRNRESLTNLLQQLYNPASPLFRQYLTPEQFTEKFGPGEQDYQTLIAFAGTNGFTITTAHPNRVLLDVTAAAADIQKVFHLTLRVYQHPKEARTFYAPDTEPSLDLSVPLLDVSGLNDYILPQPRLRKMPSNTTAQPTPRAGSGPGGAYLGNDFRAVYAPGVSLTGAGQVVGLVQFDGFYTNDITAYETQAGLPNVPLQTILLDGYNGVPTTGSGSGNGEVSLDIEMVISMAPGLSKVMVYEAGPRGIPNDILNRMATDNEAKQLSCSWGWSGGPSTTTDQIFQQMVAQGQSFFTASGDSDAYPPGAIDDPTKPNTPSDNPYITVVGGTTLTTSGPGGTWVSETVWNWGGGTGSSGGISSHYAIPSWQQGISMSANLGSTVYRNIPDVALTADNVYVRYNNGSSGTFGGTSCAAPLWAAFAALVNQQAAVSGQAPVGFLNPALYAIGKGTNFTSDFHDITTGNNTSSSSPSQFYAVTGYDLCTGWGTPKGAALINTLAAPTPPGITNAGSALVLESCAPTNGAADPGETVTVNFALRNVGTLNTTNLVATLQANGGVISPSAPQTYGVLAGLGAAVSRPFTFTANGTCGGNVTATLQLQDGTASLGTVTFNLPLGQLLMTTAFAENFDALTAPALPAGWTTSASRFQSAWVTSTSATDIAPNAAFSAAPQKAGVNELVTPAIAVTSAATRLTFRNSYNLEQSYDGGVLEISIGGAPFTDILAAGGSFASGGYTALLNASSANPLAGRQAWTGNSGGFVTTVVNLPAVAVGQNIQLKWRCGTDTGTSSPGWYVDTVSLASGSFACCTLGADLAVSQAASPSPALVGQVLNYTLAVANLGPAAASSVTLTDSLPNNVTFVSASPGCVNLGGKVVCTAGTLASGAGTNFNVWVTPAVEGILTNLLTVASGTPDPNPANNTSTNILAANAPPGITTPPVSQSVAAGSNVLFSVTATGTRPLAYQWAFNGTRLAGATASTLGLANVQPPQAGSYTAVVTNVAGAVTSTPAILRVLVPPTVSSISRAGTAASLSFTSAPGLSYTLEYKNFLTDLTWTLLPPPQVGTGGTLVLQDTNAVASGRFYRVRCE